MTKYRIHRLSTKEVIVEADSDEEALEKAYDAEREAFVEVDYDWEIAEEITEEPPCQST